MLVFGSVGRWTHFHDLRRFGQIGGKKLPNETLVLDMFTPYDIWRRDTKSSFGDFQTAFRNLLSARHPLNYGNAKF